MGPRVIEGLKNRTGGSVRCRRDPLIQSRLGLTQGPWGSLAKENNSIKVWKVREKGRADQRAKGGQKLRGHQEALQLPLQPGSVTPQHHKQMGK